MGLLDGPHFPGGKLGISSAAFKVPFIRHLWSWVGVMPASKEHLLAQLTSGKTACIVPGGVQECFHLEDGCEVSVEEGLRMTCSIIVEKTYCLLCCLLSAAFKYALEISAYHVFYTTMLASPLAWF